MLAEVSESQWGMVTSAQAHARGVSHMNLTRLTESGDLVRLAHGVYRDAGAPGSEYEELRSAWLAAEPTRLAWDRLQEKPGSVIVSGESAATVHGIGNLRAMRNEFTTRSRKQTQRPDVHYRTRMLSSDDVTVREGLPVTTPERTIADLVEQRTQFDHVGEVLLDAARKSRLDMDRLVELLAPLAERNGHSKRDGSALLEELLETARVDLHSLAQQIVTMPDLGALVTRDYLARIDTSPLFDSPAFQSALDRLAASIVAAAATFDARAPRSILEAHEEQVATMAAALSKLVAPEMAGLTSMQKAIASLGSTSAVLGTDSAQKRLSEAITARDWASLTQRAKRIEVADDEDEL